MEAEALNKSGFGCFQDTHEMDFLESSDCVVFSKIYPKFLAAKERAEHSLFSYAWRLEFAKADNRALDGMVLYSWALTSLGLIDPKAFRDYLDSDFVINLHKRSGKSYRKRNPDYTR